MNTNTTTAPAPTAEATAAPQIVENRDLAAAITEPPAPATSETPTAAEPTRSTRQFDLGNGRRLVDMRRTSGPVEIIPEAPGVNFDGLPTMTEREAILAAFHIEGSDDQKFALIRQIAAATH
jgi:hypothetical protein